MRKIWVIAVFILVLPLLSVMAGGASQSDVKFPAKPVEVIVPMAAGGASDLTARAMEKVAKQYLGQSLVINNVVGASGIIGYNQLSGSPKDGYTLGLSSANMLLQPLYGLTPNQYGTMLEPIAQAVYNPISVSVLSSSPIKSIDDLIKYAKENPGKIKYAYSNVGSLPHVVSGMFVNQTGVKMDPVPFATGAESTQAFLGGHVQLLFSSIVEVKNRVKEGTVRILAISSPGRMADLPDIPTLKECKLDIDFTPWFGICAPAGISADAKKALAEGFKKIISDAEFIKAAQNLGYIVDYLGPEESAKKWKSETEAFRVAVKVSGIADEMAAQAGKK